MKNTPEKILIIKPSALGDIIHTLPVLPVLRAHYPGAEIHWLVAKGFHTVLENHPMIDRLWTIDKNKWKKVKNLKDTFKELKELKNNLKSESFDLVIDFQGLFRTGLIASFTASKKRIGFKQAREGAPLFYTDKVDVDWEGIHAVDRYLKLLEHIGCDISKVEFPFAPFEENIPLMKELPEKYAVIVPSAGKKANRWPADRFGQVASKLPIKTVVVSSPADAEIADEVVQNSNGQAISVAGRTTIMELAALIKKAEYMITNDTGPMHIAAAFGIPAFAIFGPANPIRTGPYGKIHTVISLNLPCAPCYAKKTCSTWECMENITVDMVYETIKEKTSKKANNDR